MEIMFHSHNYLTSVWISVIVIFSIFFPILLLNFWKRGTTPWWVLYFLSFGLPLVVFAIGYVSIATSRGNFDRATVSGDTIIFSHSFTSEKYNIPKQDIVDIKILSAEKGGKIFSWTGYTASIRLNGGREISSELNSNKSVIEKAVTDIGYPIYSN